MPAQHAAVPSLRTVLLRAVGRLAGAGVGFVVVLAVGLVLVPRSTLVTAERPPRHTVVDPVASLVQTYGCWHGQPPAGVGVPGHAIVTLPGQAPRLVRSQVGFDIWLEGRPGQLHAFCR